MDTLDRYLVKELIIYFVLILLGLSVLFLAVDFLTKVWTINLPVSKILVLYLYKSPEAFRQFVPVACLMSTLLVVSSMSKQNEVIALYSSGISSFRIAYTFIACVAAISAVTFTVLDPLVPTLEKKRQLIEKGRENNGSAFLEFNRDRFWYRSGKVIYNVGHFNPKNNLLESINLFVLGPNGGIEERIQAQRAFFENNDWIIQQGYSTTYTNGNFPMIEPFKEKRGLIPEKPSDYKTLEVQPETMRLKELRRYISRNRSFGLDTTRQQVSYHERLSMVFTPIIFVLLGITFALKPLKTQSVAKGVGFCFLVVFIYLVICRLTVSVGKEGHIPPFMAGWTPNLMFLAIASMTLWKRK